MTILPLPNTINVPATYVGSNLSYNDASINLTGSYENSKINIITSNKNVLVLDELQRVGINTNNTTTAQLSINSETSNIVKFSYKENYPVLLSINPSNGNTSLSITGTKLSINNSIDIINHNKSTVSGLLLAGVLVTATATQINALDTISGTASASKVLIVDSNRNITNINSLQATSLTGTIQTTYQPLISSVNTLNIQNHNSSTTGLSLNGILVTATADELNYTKVLTLGIAQPSKALVVDNTLNISNINNISCTQLYGSIRTANQSFITTIGSLSNLSVLGNIGVGYNGRDSFFRIDIRSSTGNCLKLTYADTSNDKYSDFTVNSNGSLNINSTNGNIFIQSNNNFRINTHNGIDRGLWLNGVLVMSSATQLNYVNTPVGVGNSNKALILDINKNITGINNIQTNTLEGIITTTIQPNINEVNVLNIKQHNQTDLGLKLNGILITASAEEINYISVIKGTATGNKALVLDSNRNITNINSLQATSLTGTIQTTYQPSITKVDFLNISLHNGTTNGLFLGNQLVTSTATQLNYNNVVVGVASATKTLVVDSNRNITNINSLQATSLTGTIQTSIQPLISSVNTLNIQNHNGSTTGLSLNGILITATATQINYINIIPGNTLPNKALVLNSSKSITGINELSASLITGQLVTTNQPNIQSVKTLDITDHNGATTGLSLGGTLITVTASEINYLDVIAGTALENKALVLNNLKSISNINNISANTISAVLTTQYQPNITRINELDIINHNGTTTGLKLNNILVECTATQLNRNNNVLGVAVAEKNLSVDINKNIIGINSLSSNLLSGTLQTSIQPNITVVNTLNISNHNGSTVGLSLNGVLVSATANEINYLKTTVGTGFSLKALILDTSKNIRGINLLSATLLEGSLQTAYQPNITSVDILNIKNHTGSSGLQLNGSLVIASADQLNRTTSVAGIASPLKALITNEVNSLSGINTLNTTKIITDSMEVNGVIKNINTGGLITRTYSSVDFIGRVVDMQLLSLSSFSNISPAGLSNNFSMEIIGYIRPQFSETYTFFIQCQDRVRLWVNNQLILCSWTYVSTARMSTTIFLDANRWYPIYIQYQVDSNNSLFLIEWTSSSTVRSAIPSSRMAWDNINPQHSINEYVQNTLSIYNSSTASLNQTTFTVDNSGDLIIDSSGNDIRFGLNDNINIPSHNGTTSGLFLGGQLVTPTAFEINYLKVSPGVSIPTHALVVDGTNSITGLTSLTSTALTCRDLSASNFSISNLVLTGPLSNFNTGGLIIKQITGPDLSGRVVDVNLTTTLSLTDYDPKGLNTYFSLEISGYILPQFTENYIFYVTANDRARVWINNQLMLNIWDTYTGIEYASSPISLIANRWTKIYIQFQNITGSSFLQVKWSSISTTKNLINSSFMAWDNTDINISKNITALDSINIIPSSSIIGIQSGSFTIDTSGSMNISTSGNIISINDQNSLNIAGHNNLNKGLMLNNVLITASATEINYLSNSTAGTAGGNKVMILDTNRNITNINNLTANNLNGTLLTSSQPNITSIGTLSSSLLVSADTIIGNLSNTDGRIRIISTLGTSYIQSGINNTTNSSNDLMFGNMNTDSTSSSKRFMIKSNGSIGIQTNTPNRTLSINGSGNTYALRIINNNNSGTETSGFSDMGVDTNGNLIVAPNGASCNILSNLRIGTDTANATFTMNASSLKINSTSGSIQIGNTTSSDLPLEVGSSNFSISTGTYGFINSTGSIGIKADSTITAFSIRTSGRIIAGGEIDIISDRRSKYNIQSLNIDTCKTFIENANPVSFKYKNSEESKTHYGFIAQDIFKAGFENLVSLVPDDTISKEIENDGFINPDKQKFVLCYDEIIPILATNIKSLYRENEELKKMVEILINEIKVIKSKLI